MKFISHDQIDLVLNNLTDLNFTISNLSDLNNDIEINGDKIEYGYLSKNIRKMGPDERDILYKNASICIDSDYISNCSNILVQAINHILLEVPRCAELDLLKGQSKRYSESIREFRQIKRDFYKEFNEFENRFNYISTEFDDIQSNFKTFGDNFSSIKNDFDRFENRIGSIQGEFISILSIFAAMFITFFGGVQMLGSLMSAIENTNFYVLSMITIIIGIIMFNIIYILLYTIGKITNKNIGIDILNSNCSTCSKKSLLSCIISKYPIPFFYNLFSILLFVLLFMLHIMNDYGIIKYFSTSFIWLMNHKKYLNIAVIVISSVIFLLFIATLLIFSISKIHNLNSCTHKCGEVHSKETKKSKVLN